MRRLEDRGAPGTGGPGGPAGGAEGWMRNCRQIQFYNSLTIAVPHPHPPHPLQPCPQIHLDSCIRKDRNYWKKGALRRWRFF